MARDVISEFVNRLQKSVAETDERPSDGRLLERFVSNGDEAAFATLVDRFGPMVLGICRRIVGDSHTAEDAFQATFLVLASKAASLTRRELVGNWLCGVAFRIARHAKTDAAHWHARRREFNEETAFNPVDEVMWRDLRPVLDEEINRLPKKYRRLFVMCYLEGKTNKEAAQAIRCPTGTIATRLARAREILRTRLTRRGITLSYGVIAIALTRQARANVPARLSCATSRIAALYTAGNIIASDSIASGAVALAERGLKSMLLTKSKTIAALFIAAVILASINLPSIPRMLITPGERTGNSTIAGNQQLNVVGIESQAQKIEKPSADETPQLTPTLSEEAKENGWPEYAKVEAVGMLQSTHESREPMKLIVSRDSGTDAFPLETKRLQGWTEDDLLRANGKLIWILGRVERKSVGIPGNRVELDNVISVRTLDLFTPKVGRGATARGAMDYCRVELLGELNARVAKGELLNVAVHTRPDNTTMRVDLSKLAGWTNVGLNWAGDPSHRVYVTGDLTMRKGKPDPGDRMLIRVKTMDVRPSERGRWYTSIGGQGFEILHRPYYANVEITGILRCPLESWKSMRIEVPMPSKAFTFYLDIGKLPGRAERDVRNLDGKVVRVNGTVEYGEINVSQDERQSHLVILAKTLELNQAKLTNAKSKDISDAARIEICGDYEFHEAPDGLSYVLLDTGPANTAVRVDISSLTGWNRLRIVNSIAESQAVRMTGTLETRKVRFAPGEQLVMVARTIDFVPAILRKSRY